MESAPFLNTLNRHGIDFFTGVPDSLLQPFCSLLYRRYGLDAAHHVVGHNEGGCVGLAAGHHLATGSTPCVYLQNSGIGNLVNPVASLTSPLVYAIPVLYVVGWRGQPGVKDEPQHLFQGQATQALLADLDIETATLTADTAAEELESILTRFDTLLNDGKSVALLVEKNALTGDGALPYENPWALSRERAVEIISQAVGGGVIVSSTGKISRELFEIRETRGEGHAHDFLTVGSMGHDAMIALGIALKKPGLRVLCLDGDGSFLMHLGAAGLVASLRPENYTHIVLNNAAHETVGGMPTYAAGADLPALALALGYQTARRAESEEALRSALNTLKGARGPSFLEVRVAMGSRANLGRPTTTPAENKEALMVFLAATEKGQA